MLIRALEPNTDVEAVWMLYQRAEAFWTLTDRKAPDRQMAADFFTDGPPGCDPARSHRLGVFQHSELVGVAELSFGFPNPEDAYLGLMLLAPDDRGKGLGSALLAEVIGLAKARGAPRLLLAVLEENIQGRAFWEAKGFRATGLCRFDAETKHTLHRLALGL